MAALNNFIRLWGAGNVSSCLGPGPGVVRVGNSNLECASPVKEIVVVGVVGLTGSELACLLMKRALTGESFTVSSDWLALGGAVPPESARTRMSKNQKYRK